MRHTLFATTLGLLLTLPGFVAAQTERPVQQNNSDSVWFENWIGLTNAVMRVASPDGDISDVVAANGTPVFTIRGANVVDGIYRYELRASTEELVKNRDYVEDGTNGNDAEYLPKPLYITGYFRVERGVIVRPEDIKEEPEE